MLRPAGAGFGVDAGSAPWLFARIDGAGLTAYEARLLLRPTNGEIAPHES
jgi:hypothetical protein